MAGRMVVTGDDGGGLAMVEELQTAPPGSAPDSG